MLAITPIKEIYLTAVELGIRDDEREALIWVRGELAEGRLVYVQDINAINVECAFNMEAFGSGCGTPACIGGWVAVKIKQNQEDYVFKVRSAALRPLYWPWSIDADWTELTPAQAVRAIDAFLTGAGDRCWHVALEAEG